MIRFLIYTMVALFIAAPTWACSPPPPGISPPSALAIAGGMLAGENRFVGKVQIENFEPTQGNDNKVKFKVLKQYAGPPMKEITVETKGNTCGVYSPVVGKVDIISVELPGLPILQGGPQMPIGNDDLEDALDTLTKKKSTP